MKVIKQLIMITLIALVIFMYKNAFAVPFTNGDFSNGFTGWIAEVYPYSAAHPLKKVNPVIDTNFSIIGATQEARISDNDTYWMDGLYQDFDAPSLIASGYKLDINFWIKWAPTDSTIDNISVTLGNKTSLSNLLTGISTSDLLSGTTITQDVTRWAGTPVNLLFLLWDSDLNTPDYLYIDNITFTQVPPPSNVPEPATIFLLGSGMLGLLYKKRK